MGIPRSKKLLRLCVEQQEACWIISFVDDVPDMSLDSASSPWRNTMRGGHADGQQHDALHGHCNKQ